MPDTQEQLLTEITALDPTDFVRVVNNPITLPDSAVIQKSKFVDNLFGDVITPVTNGAVPDWAPTGLVTAHIVRIFPSGPTSISGMTTGVLGRVLFLQNVGSSLVSLLNESTLSASANRFQLPGATNYVLQPNSLAIALYDTTASRWRVVAASTYNDGWVALGSFFTFVSVDGATTNVTITGDATDRIQRGTKVKYTQSQSLTAYWNLDSSSASQVGSFPGTDTAMTYTAGKFGNAGTFDGATSKIVLTDTASLKPTGEFTIGFWMKSSYLGGTQSFFQSWSQNTFYAGIAIQTIGTSGKIRCYIGKNTGTSATVDLSYLDTNTMVCDGNFHYIVLTYRNNYLQLYVDGVLESAIYSYAPAYAATNYVRIGCSNNTGTDGNFTNGQIDDVFLINGYALDEQTIKAKYQAQTAQGTSSLSLTKYGIVTNVGAYNGTLTPVTFWGGTDFTSVSGTFGTPYISTAKAPHGFNASPDKWTILVQSAASLTQSSPTAGVFYNIGGLNIVAPIGQWRMNFTALQEVIYSAAAIVQMGLKTTLSTSPSAESDVYNSSHCTFLYPITTAATRYNHVVRRNINVQTKTTYYLISQVGQTSTSTTLRGDLVGISIALECAYL